MNCEKVMDSFIQEIQSYPHYSNIEKRMEEVQEIIDYQFKDIRFLMLAFCRTKCNLEGAGKNNKSYKNDTLAQIGDAILNLFVFEFGFEFEMPKGKIDNLRQILTNNATFSSVRGILGLENFCYHDKHFFDDPNVLPHERVAVSNHDPIIEALVGAIYLDGGIEEAKKWFWPCLGKIIKR